MDQVGDLEKRGGPGVEHTDSMAQELLS